jgi:hypothetical protein
LPFIRFTFPNRFSNRTGLALHADVAFASKAQCGFEAPNASAIRQCQVSGDAMGEPYQLIEKSTRTDELQSAEYVRLKSEHEFLLLWMTTLCYGSPWPLAAGRTQQHII